MYPEGYSVSISVGNIGEILCGRRRKGHFNGVATVVAKLFNIVMPHKAYFGQKDFQQTVIIKKLVNELCLDIDIVVCPIIREPDGLAMSSRNSYLSSEERKVADSLYKALEHARKLVLTEGVDEPSTVRREIEDILSRSPLIKPEYVEILAPDSLEPLDKMAERAVICLAARLGETRLIDNIIIER